MKKVIAMRNGERLRVVRPQDPQLALKKVRELQQEEGLERAELEKRFNALLCEQPYTFVGYYARDRKSILDEKGWAIGKMRPGDSFVGGEIVKINPAKIGDRIEFFGPDEDPTVDGETPMSVAITKKET